MSRIVKGRLSLLSLPQKDRHYWHCIDKFQSKMTVYLSTDVVSGECHAPPRIIVAAGGPFVDFYHWQCGCCRCKLSVMYDDVHCDSVGKNIIINVINILLYFCKFSISFMLTYNFTFALLRENCSFCIFISLNTCDISASTFILVFALYNSDLAKWPE